ncbi:Ferrous-iron efflux pump FieF [Rubripirellula obstinata]|uniref:Ferrous-iron efflux pump FieF n=1 Tax=Rubripirellula obstinata TaxID=406547 RepID=A0A5B1CM11_9BACT|nr:Ferrous-iron efflux pump FieF [Rubripirellula obstinata]
MPLFHKGRPQFPRQLQNSLSKTKSRDQASIDHRQRVYVDASRAAVWGLGVNLVLMVAKLAGGIVTGSSALIADAVNSVGDVASALAVRGALGVAQIEEDEDHPYGHTKAESIAGLCVALLVAFSAGILAIETFKRFGEDLEVPGKIAGVIAAVCGITKEIIYRYTRRVAGKLDSTALKAAAWDHRSDAIGSGLVAVSLLSAPLLGPLAPWVDPIAAICVCGVLVFTGVRIFSHAARELMDQQADSEMVNLARQIAGSVDQVQDVEKLRIRKSGLEYFAEIHIQIDGNLSVSTGHRIGHKVKDRLLAEMPRVRDVHVHIEPFEP